MDWEQIIENFKAAFQRLLACRLVVENPDEIVADLPILYVILGVVMMPWLALALVVFGYLFKYRAHFEQV